MNPRGKKRALCRATRDNNDYKPSLLTTSNHGQKLLKVSCLLAMVLINSSLAVEGTAAPTIAPITNYGVYTLPLTNFRINFYFEDTGYQIMDDERQMILTSETESHADAQIKSEIEANSLNSFQDSVLTDIFIQIKIKDSMIDSCDGTTTLDCKSMKFSSTAKLNDIDSISLDSYKSLLIGYLSKAFEDSKDVVLNNLQNSNDGMISKVYDVDISLAKEGRSPSSIVMRSVEENLVFERVFTWNFFFIPMLAFSIINIVVCVAGNFVLIINMYEERRSNRVQLHKDNHMRLVKEASLLMNETEIEDYDDDEVSSHLEIIEIDGLGLAINATDDEFELVLV